MVDGDDNKALPDWLIFAGGTVVGILLVLMLKWILKDENQYPYPYHYQQSQPVEHHYYHNIPQESHSKGAQKSVKHEEEGYYVLDDEGKMHHHSMKL